MYHSLVVKMLDDRAELCEFKYQDHKATTAGPQCKALNP